MGYRLGVIGPKAQDLVIYFFLVLGETIPQFHLRELHARTGIFLLKYDTGKINNFTGKYILELPKLKHL